MSVAKYSPTVSAAYHHDAAWWEKHKDALGIYDRDGYDSYGYNSIGKDRAGRLESDYQNGEDVCGEWIYPLYEQIDAEWTINPKTGLPCSFKNLRA